MIWFLYVVGALLFIACSSAISSIINNRIEAKYWRSRCEHLKEDLKKALHKLDLAEGEVEHLKDEMEGLVPIVNLPEEVDVPDEVFEKLAELPQPPDKEDEEAEGIKTLKEISEEMVDLVRTLQAYSKVVNQFIPDASVPSAFAEAGPVKANGGWFVGGDTITINDRGVYAVSGGLPFTVTADGHDPSANVPFSIDDMRAKGFDIEA